MTTTSKVEGLAARHFGRSGMVLLALLFALGGCGRGGGQPGKPESGTPGAERGGVPRISDRCLAGRWIEPYQAAEAGDWSKVQVAERETCFELAAVDSTALGVDPTSSFVFTTTDDLTEEAVQSLLRVEPTFTFRVEAEPRAAWPSLGVAHAAGATSYRVVPTEPLAEGALYRFALLDQPDGLSVQEWSFETARPAKVVHTLPGNEAVNVPLDTGIELVFSHDAPSGVEERFRIEPPVKGRFETHKRTVVFVPEKLEPGTIYRVTVEAGVQVANGAASMAAPYEFAFETAVAEAPRETTEFAWTREFWDEPTTEAPVLTISAFGSDPNALAGTPVSLTLLRFTSLDQYAQSVGEYSAVPEWSWHARQEFEPSTAGLEPYASLDDIRLEPMGESQEYLVRLPAPLPAGQYLLRLALGSSERFAWLQASDIGAYVAISEPRLVVWVNDVANGQPVSGARVSVLGGAVLGRTDADGLLAVNTPSGLVRSQSTPWGYTQKSAPVDLLIEHQNRVLLVTMAAVGSQPGGGFGPFAGADERHRYWRYVYADRPLYHPSDVVRFWGFVRPRDGGAAVERLTVRIAGGDFTGYSYEWLPIAETVVTPNEAGTYLGELTLSGATPGYYSLEVRAGEVLLASTSLEVRDFVKPAYKIDVECDAQAVFIGDPVSVAVSASFFDGQPVAGLDLRVSTSAGQEEEVRTDETGRANVTLAAPSSLASEALYLGYAWFGVYVRPAREEEGEISGMVQLQAFPAQVTVDGEGLVDDTGQAVIEGRVHTVDLSRLNSGQTLDFDDFLGQVLSGQTVTARVTEYSYVKVKTGQQYDFVSKRVVDAFRFDQVERAMGPYSATTSGEGGYRVAFDTRPDAGYEVIVAVRDAAGRTAERRVYLGRAYMAMSGGRLVLRSDQVEPYALGQRVVARLSTESDEPVPVGRYLFIRARNGILDQTVLDRPQYEFEFTSEHIPNVEVLAVAFTGRTFVEAEWPISAVFDSSGRELKVELEADRERYAPGDKVELSVRTRRADGQPVAARVLLAAVDEAIFRVLGPEVRSYVNILGNLYTPAPSGLVSAYGSHALPEAFGAGAERGGGGGERADFRDVALFQEVVTGNDGRGRTSFALPDNLTSWRVTAQAIAPDLEAGLAVVSIPVGLPLFALVTMNDEYLAGDEPVVELRAYGDALASDDEVRFRVEVPSLLERPVELTGRAFQAVEVPLPELSAGRFELRATVLAGELSDSLVRTFRVLPSRWLRVGSAYDEVSAGGQYAIAERPGSRVTLTLSDASRGRYATFLEALTWSSGDRLDQRLARYLALGLRARYFASGEEAGDFALTPYQVSSGGLALFPYGDADLDLTVRAILAAPRLFGREALIRYLAEVARDPEVTSDRLIAALLGLAALGQPVLRDLSALSGLDSLSPLERLDLATGFAVAGDQQTALRFYRELLAEFGQARGSTVRLNLGMDQDDVLVATARAAALGALLGEPSSLALFAYSTQNPGQEALVPLEQVAFLEAALPRLRADELQLSYFRFGQRQQVTLGGGESLSLSLSPEELAALDLRVTSGTAGITRLSLEPVDLATAATDSDIAVEREYVVNGRPVPDDEPVRLSLGDEVLVRLRWRLGHKAVDSCYQLSDLLPSGLRPVTALYSPHVYYEDSETLWPYAVEGQRVSFCVWRGGRQTAAYRARPLSKGTYLAEPASIQAQAAPESWNHSPPRRIEIR